MFDRYFIDDAGTIIDRTIPWSNPFTATGAWDCKTYLYVSSFFPFNHKFFEIETANDQAGTLTIDIWYNNAWVSVADIIDYTKGTNTLEVSGNINFTVDKDEGWDQEDDSSDITELADTKVYSVYWMRFGYDASSDSALVINYIGNRFCDDNALFSQYPLFNNSSIMTRFKAGKADWTTQEVSASDAIITDLKSRNMILSKDQILDSKRYEIPCVHKTAEIIFAGLGISYAEDRADARKYYTESMNSGDWGIDQNLNGNYDRSEKTPAMMRVGR